MTKRWESRLDATNSSFPCDSVRIPTDSWDGIRAYKGTGCQRPVWPAASSRFCRKTSAVRAAWLEVVLKRFAEATSFASAKEMMTTLEQFDRIPLAMLRDVEPALRTKVDLREAYGVPDRFRNLLPKPGGRHYERGNAPVSPSRGGTQAATIQCAGGISESGDRSSAGDA